jgi:membrane protein implicated in regulation of membrane protease activity
MDDRSPNRLIWLLLIVPYVGLLWVPFYNTRTPELWGFPFFYWYQLIWVPITAALTWLVYRSSRRDD